MKDFTKKLLLTTVATALITVTVVCSAAALKPVTGTVERFNVTATTIGANEILAGVAGQQYLITSITITSCSDTEETFYLSSGAAELWYSAATPKAIDQTSINGYSGISLPGFPGGHFLTTAGEDFTINLTVGEDVNVMGTYLVVQ